MVENLVSVFAFSLPNELYILILEQVDKKIDKGHKVILSTSSLEVKLILGGEYHVAPKYSRVLL